MNGYLLPLGICAFVLFDLMVVTMVVRGFVGFCWNPINKRFPPIEPGPDAIRWNFRSFHANNLLGMSWSVHVAVDDTHLHLYPAAIMRWFDAKPASVPWDEVKPVGKPGGWHSRVKIAGIPIDGPKDCLRIAFVAAGDAT